MITEGKVSKILSSISRWVSQGKNAEPREMERWDSSPGADTSRLRDLPQLTWLLWSRFLRLQNERVGLHDAIHS